MRQLTSVIFEGIPERFPDLRIAFLEAGWRLGALLDGADGRRVRKARAGGARPQEEAERVRPIRQDLLLLRGDEWLLGPP